MEGPPIRGDRAGSYRGIPALEKTLIDPLFTSLPKLKRGFRVHRVFCEALE